MSMSSSEQDAEEQWDDMAIVRAFEEALTDQRTRSSTSTKPTGRKQKATARWNGKKAARSVSIEEQDDDEEQYNGYPAEASGVPMNGQPNAAGYAATAASPFVFQQQAQQQQQSSSDLYQAAYAQAYAQLQAQFQAACPPAAPQLFGQGPAMPAFSGQSSYYPQPPPMPSMPTPFSGATTPFPGSTPSTATSDDGLANVLMAWYQSGYYTGRFQAMQEMKTRGRR